MIGSALGIGVAVQTTGLADQIATRVVNVFGGFGNTFLVFGLVLATMVLTEFTSNSAAAALMLPVALQIASVEGINTTTMAIGVAIAASRSFITPIGYQTNTMVLGPGGYTFTDYLRLGAPMAVGVLITITTMVMMLSEMDA